VHHIGIAAMAAETLLEPGLEPAQRTPSP
jgi:hypothetical protein